MGFIPWWFTQTFGLDYIWWEPRWKKQTDGTSKQWGDKHWQWVSELTRTSSRWEEESRGGKTNLVLYHHLVWTCEAGRPRIVPGGSGSISWARFSDGPIWAAVWGSAQPGSGCWPGLFPYSAAPPAPTHTHTPMQSITNNTIQLNAAHSKKVSLFT